MTFTNNGHYHQTFSLSTIMKPTRWSLLKKQQLSWKISEMFYFSFWNWCCVPSRKVQPCLYVFGVGREDKGLLFGVECSSGHSHLTSSCSDYGFTCSFKKLVQRAFGYWVSYTQVEGGTNDFVFFGFAPFSFINAQENRPAARGHCCHCLEFLCAMPGNTSHLGMTVPNGSFVLKEFRLP